MDDITRADYETRSQTIRAELKQWETSWAKTHAGNKPSRDDIKQNPDIGMHLLLWFLVCSMMLTRLCSSEIQILQQAPRHSLRQASPLIKVDYLFSAPQAKIYLLIIRTRPGTNTKQTPPDDSLRE